jgi:epoxyqueuosine reductase
MAGTLEERLKQQARELGFDLVGIAPAAPADGFEHLRSWLAAGYAGTMDYLHKRAEARRHPSSILPGVRSVVMVAMSYNDAADSGEDSSPRPVQSGAPGAVVGKVARYARGADYHGVLWQSLGRLLEWLQGERPGCVGRAVADSAPLLERNFARRAGLGWIGKNTLLLNRVTGSYVVLGALLVDVDLRPDTPFEADHCGSCTACLDACPTDAFPAPGVLDARRCVSYLTIEHKGPIPPELRRGVGDWLFGCDICQEVCPWNRKASAGTEPKLQPLSWLTALDAVELLGLSEEEFRRRFEGTALLRPRRRGLLRNAAVVLGNTGDRSALPALRRALEDPEANVRDAAAAAIAEIERRCGPGSDDAEARPEQTRTPAEKNEGAMAAKGP